LSGDWYTVLLFAVCWGFPGSRTLFYGGLLKLISLPRIAVFWYTRPHGTSQPAAGPLIPSDQSTNLSQQFKS